MLKNSFNILISASNFLSRQGLRAIISSLPEYNLSEADSGSMQEQLKSFSHLTHLIVHEVESGCDMDVSNQIATVTKNLEVRVLLIIDKIERESVQQYIKSGVKGIITRQCSKDEIINAISTTLKSELFLCSKVLNVLLEKEKSNAEQKKAEMPTLSNRELEVLSHITKGYTTIAIADMLNISVHTVNSHRKNILKKLNLKSPIELIVYAMENDLVEKS